MSSNNRGRRSGSLSQVNVLVAYAATMLVCLLLFGSIALYLLDRFVTAPAEQSGEELSAVTEDETGETDYSFARQTVLFVGAGSEDINAMAILRILPDEGKILIVPVSKYTLSSAGGASGTLLELYSSGGMTFLKQAVESSFGVECSRYVKISDGGWKSLVEYLGGTSTYNFPEELLYKNQETGELTSFSQGPATRTLWGDDIRRIVTYPLYSDGERTRLQVVGEIGVSLLNSAFLTNSENIKSNLTSIFNTIFNNSDTDITSPRFREVSPAYEYMLDSFDSPASYRLPKGVWNESGYFEVSSDFPDELREYFMLNE